MLFELPFWSEVFRFRLTLTKYYHRMKGYLKVFLFYF